MLGSGVEAQRWGRMAQRSVGEEWCKEVLEKSTVGEEWCREVLGKSLQRPVLG